MRCDSCGTEGQENSIGRFVSRDWLRCQDLQAKIYQLEADKKQIAEECAKIAEEHITTTSVHATAKEAKAATGVKNSIAAVIRNRYCR